MNGLRSCPSTVCPPGHWAHPSCPHRPSLLQHLFSPYSVIPVGILTSAISLKRLLTTLSTPHTTPSFLTYSAQLLQSRLSSISSLPFSNQTLTHSSTQYCFDQGHQQPPQCQVQRAICSCTSLGPSAAFHTAGPVTPLHSASRNHTSWFSFYPSSFSSSPLSWFFLIFSFFKYWSCRTQS